MKRALVSWSGGKDAAWALHRTRGEFEIAALVTTVSEVDGSVPIHGVPGSLVKAQAVALDLDIWNVPLPQPCSNAVYTERMSAVWKRARNEEIDTVIFGDLFLADIRQWREELLAPVHLTALFPLWLEATAGLAREMIAGGLRATVCAPGADRGKRFDETFLRELPAAADPCGENGEFHTFVTWMPGFKKEVGLCAE